jgi:hypothetical protein
MIRAVGRTQTLCARRTAPPSLPAGALVARTTSSSLDFDSTAAEARGIGILSVFEKAPCRTVHHEIDHGFDFAEGRCGASKALRSARPWARRGSLRRARDRMKQLKGGRYTLLRTLGEGSQGETYEGRDNGAATERPSPEHLGRDWQRYVARARAGQTRDSRGLVAIKCFRVQKARAWKDVELAEREARTLASLDHPRLPRYIEHFEEGGALYLVMEKIEGESLSSLRSRGRTMSPSEITTMLGDIGGALRYLHARAPAIVHRDIKPGNILRTPDGSFALVDFGAVRDRLKPGGGSTVVGTFGYMAPEQFQGRAAPSSDVYGLGATALAMITGREPEDLPHEGLGIDVARALPKGTPPPLARALTAMLAPDPDRRAATIDEALALLSAAEQPEPAAEHAEFRKRGRREKKKKKRRRRRGRGAPPALRLIASALLVVALLVVSLAVWIVLGVVVPLLLRILAMPFGERLRRAARSCVSAERRSRTAMRRAADWLAGARGETEGETEAGARVRVDAEVDADRVRVSVPGEEAQEPGEETSMKRGSSPR